MKNKEQFMQQLEDDIRLRGLAEKTLERYTICVQTFLEYCNRPVEQLNEEDIRNFLLFLLNERKLCPSTINLYSAAIRFFFAVTLNRALSRVKGDRCRPSLPSEPRLWLSPHAAQAHSLG